MQKEWDSTLAPEIIYLQLQSGHTGGEERQLFNKRKQGVQY